MFVLVKFLTSVDTWISFGLIIGLSGAAGILLFAAIIVCCCTLKAEVTFLFLF